MKIPRWSLKTFNGTAVVAAVSLIVSVVLLPASAAGAATSGAGGGAGARSAAGARGAQVTDPASLVNPFIGTEDGGDTFPGPDAPFGMVQWGPDTSPTRPDGGGYYYPDSQIIGFSLAHLSGPGCKSEGDLPILPTTGTGTPSLSATESFAHSTESADAGYYKVTLGNGVTTALTATTRTGMAQFTFPSSAADLTFKLDASEDPDTSSSFTVVSSTEVEGELGSGSFCGASNTYKMYFDMQFNHPITASGTLNGAAPIPQSAQVSPAVPEQPNHPVYHGPLPHGSVSSGRPAQVAQSARAAFTGPDGAYLRFDTTSLLAKVGLSYVSDANAAANLKAENPGWDFDSTLAATQSAWNALLGKIAITGGTSAQQAEFYTAMYHALLFPSTFSDDNGQYMGVDGKVHTVDSGHSAFYTNFSGWDIYRSQAELEALIDPQVASDTAESMVDDYAQDGMLPKWMENNGESYVMVGDPADSILADYYAFGARDFNTSTALADMVAEATTTSNIRPGGAYIDKPGYLPSNGTYGCCNFYGPVATTLEYDTADFAISALAAELGNPTDQQEFLDRSQDWWNVLDPDSGMDQPREANATWDSGFTPASSTDFVEADSWIYTGMVPFDLAGLTAAKGGDAAMAAYLGTVLRSFTGDDGYSYMGNEPSVELPWEYDYIGEPYQTQADIRSDQNQLWTDGPGGLTDGNDDLGEMSAWFVWSALGMYPMTPGTPTLALGSPMFTSAAVSLPSGKTLTIDGDGAADDAPYVQSATWNGSAWNDAYAPPAAITSGGTLAYTLGTSPNTSWASAASAAPPSYPGSTVLPPDPRVGPVKSGGLCMDDKQSGTTNYNPVQLFTCNQSDAQSWTIAPGGTISALGLCLDVHGSGKTSGTLVDLYECNGTGAQDWTTGSSGSLVNPESGLCLDGSTSGAQLEIVTCNGSGAQDWARPAAPPSRVGPVVSGLSSSLCVDDKGGSTANANPIVINPCSGTAEQQWTVEPDGTLRVLGKCLDVHDSGTTNNTLIDLYQCNGTGAQQWRIGSAGTLVNPESGDCLNDPKSSTAPGTQLVIYGCNGTKAQIWNLPS
jgi:predicted alpha-1,2-mannosidase